MTTLDPADVEVGMLLIRRSALTDIPVVISEMGESTFSVTLRPEQFLENVEAMTIGMMYLGEEGSPVQMLKSVGWKYSRLTGNEINPQFDSILLKE
jgi:hypothetical protein